MYSGHFVTPQCMLPADSSASTVMLKPLHCSTHMYPGGNSFLHCCEDYLVVSTWKCLACWNDGTNVTTHSLTWKVACRLSRNVAVSLQIWTVSSLSSILSLCHNTRGWDSCEWHSIQSPISHQATNWQREYWSVTYLGLTACPLPTISLFSYGCPGAHYVVQAGFSLAEITCLHLPGTGTIGMNTIANSNWKFWNLYTIYIKTVGRQRVDFYHWVDVNMARPQFIQNERTDCMITKYFQF